MSSENLKMKGTPTVSGFGNRNSFNFIDRKIKICASSETKWNKLFSNTDTSTIMIGMHLLSAALVNELSGRLSYRIHETLITRASLKI